MYDASIGRWHCVDPMAGKAHSWTPYRYCFNNPMNMIDPNGLYEWDHDWNNNNDNSYLADFTDIMGHFSTHTDIFGNVIAVFDDGDLGVYRHCGTGIGTLLAILFNHSEENTSAGGEYMGRTLYWDSFVTGAGVDRRAIGKINFCSFEARNWLNSTKPLGLMDYMNNALNFGIYDFKSLGANREMDEEQIAQIAYRGSQISDGVFVSARDAGNIFAGMFASSLIFGKFLSLKAFGALNANDNKLNWKISSQLFKNWSKPYGEDYNSYMMQKRGYEMGYPHRAPLPESWNIPSHWPIKY